MKKILSAAIVAATTLMLSATAFASCPLKNHQTSCSMGKITGAAAPVSYIVAPAQERTYMPPCKNCVPKKNWFQKSMTPFTGVYNAVFGPFTNLYN